MVAFSQLAKCCFLPMLQHILQGGGVTDSTLNNENILLIEICWANSSIICYKIVEFANADFALHFVTKSAVTFYTDPTLFSGYGCP